MPRSYVMMWLSSTTIRGRLRRLSLKVLKKGNFTPFRLILTSHLRESVVTACLRTSTALDYSPIRPLSSTLSIVTIYSPELSPNFPSYKLMADRMLECLKESAGYRHLLTPYPHQLPTGICSAHSRFPLGQSDWRTQDVDARRMIFGKQTAENPIARVITKS